MRRAAFVLALCTTGFALWAGPAFGAPTQVLGDGSDDTRPTRIVAQAASGQSNDLEIYLPDLAPGVVAIADHSAGAVTMTPGCVQHSLVEVRCDASALEQLGAALGDMDDRCSCMDEEDFPPFSFTVDGEEGDDELRLGFEQADGELITIGQVRALGGRGDDLVVLEFKPTDLDDATNGQIRIDAGPDADRVIVNLSIGWDPALAIDSGEGPDDIRLEFKPTDLDNATNGQIRIDAGPDADRVMVFEPFVLPLDPEMLIDAGRGDDAVTLGIAGVVRGGDGGDVLEGGAHDQRLYGERGNDLLSGGEGDGDVCHGGPGANTIAPDCEKTPGS